MNANPKCFDSLDIGTIRTDRVHIWIVCGETFPTTISLLISIEFGCSSFFEFPGKFWTEDDDTRRFDPSFSLKV